MKASLTLSILLLGYLVVGAFVMMYFEGVDSEKFKAEQDELNRAAVDDLLGMKDASEADFHARAAERIDVFADDLRDLHFHQYYAGVKDINFIVAFMMCFNIVTTIGYGRVFPATFGGRCFFIFYAVFGIPIFLFFITKIGQAVAQKAEISLKKIMMQIKRWRKRRRTLNITALSMENGLQETSEQVSGSKSDVENFQITFRSEIALDVKKLEATHGEQSNRLPRRYIRNRPSIVSRAERRHGNQCGNSFADRLLNTEKPQNRNRALVILFIALVLYTNACAALLTVTESWTYLNSVYFCVVTWTTVGFGDMTITSGTGVMNTLKPIICIIFILIGLIILSACFNLAQENSKQAASKLILQITRSRNLRRSLKKKRRVSSYF
ncbi:TWiK family of potassium channels protein 18-like [Ptychodera flava]|uniref:TWiK family of potassium channels protein 18-like n=1 Tax=Ptychodera flava TaxID=63121 RepID=UPI003969EACE